MFTDCIRMDDIELCGAIMGCKKIKKCTNKKPGFIVEVFFPLMTAVTFGLIIDFVEIVGTNKVGSAILLGVAILICFIIAFLTDHYSRLKNKIPKEFKEFFN